VFSLQSHRYVFQWLKWMYWIQVVTSGLLNGYVQGALGPNHKPPPPPLSLFRPLYAFRIRCLLVQGQAKIKQSSSSQVCCSLNEANIDFFWFVASWVLAAIMTESSHCLWKFDRNRGWRFIYKCFAWNFEQIVIHLPMIHQWGLMAASCSHSGGIHDEGDGLILCE